MSPTTVVAALSELRRRGIVASEERRGYRIAPRPPLRMPRRGLAIPPGVRDLASGNPDPALLPDLAAALRELDPPPRMYGQAPHVPELIELAREAFGADGIDAEHTSVVSGALDGVERVLAAYLSPGDAVAVEDPAFAGVIDLVRTLGLRLEPVPVDERGLVPKALAAALPRTRALVATLRGQNPSGASPDEARAAELRRVLGRHPGVLVVEDDYLGPVAGAPALSIATGRARWAVARSMAKSLGPDIRLALLAGDAETVARAEGRQLVGPGWVSEILQRLVVALWSDRQVRALLRRAERAYAKRRATLVDALARRGIVATGRAGLNVWVPVPEEGVITTQLLGCGWAVAPGERFRLRSSPGIRVTASTLTRAEAEAFAGDLAAALAPAPATRSG